MGQRSNDAALKDVRIKLKKEEYANGTAQIAIHTINLLHSDQISTSQFGLKTSPKSVLLELPSENDKMEAAFQARKPSTVKNSWRSDTHYCFVL
jgi:hypothetical protein